MAVIGILLSSDRSKIRGRWIHRIQILKSELCFIYNCLQ